MNEEDRAILERIAVALEKIADRPIPVDNVMWVYDPVTHTAKLFTDFVRDRA